MRVALISDIHGNLPALEAVWADLEREKADAVYNLGDTLYGPLWPEETARFLMERHVPGVMGNCDDDVLRRPDASPTLRFTRDSLSEPSLAWLASFSPILTVGDLTLFHASPGSYTDYFLEELSDGHARVKSAAAILSRLGAIPTTRAAFGHSHVPRVVSVDGTTLINAGSVGLPAYDDDSPPHVMETFNAYASYVLLDDAAVSIRFVRYDEEAAAARAESNGRPDWARWLLTGRALVPRK